MAWFDNGWSLVHFEASSSGSTELSMVHSVVGGEEREGGEGRGGERE